MSWAQLTKKSEEDKLASFVVTTWPIYFSQTNRGPFHKHFLPVIQINWKHHFAFTQKVINECNNICSCAVMVCAHFVTIWRPGIESQRKIWNLSMKSILKCALVAHGLASSFPFIILISLNVGKYKSTFLIISECSQISIHILYNFFTMIWHIMIRFQRNVLFSTQGNSTNESVAIGIIQSNAGRHLVRHWPQLISLLNLLKLEKKNHSLYCH